MPLEDFTIEQELGKGSFGIVFKCKRKIDGKIYAIKQVSSLPFRSELENLNRRIVSMP